MINEVTICRLTLLLAILSIINLFFRQSETSRSITVGILSSSIVVLLTTLISYSNNKLQEEYHIQRNSENLYLCIYTLDEYKGTKKVDKIMFAINHLSNTIENIHKRYFDNLSYYTFFNTAKSKAYANLLSELQKTKELILPLRYLEELAYKFSLKRDLNSGNDKYSKDKKLQDAKDSIYEDISQLKDVIDRNMAIILGKEEWNKRKDMIAKSINISKCNI